MKNKILILLFLSISFAFAQKGKKTTKLATQPVAAKPSISNPKEGIFAEIETTKGKIVLVLEYKKAPITVANFIALAEGKNAFVQDAYKSKPFFNGLKFHRVIKDFMIQGGDPLGNGSGDPGYKFKDEFVSDLVFDKGGILAMANSGPTTNGSQFFITHKETPWLNGKHTIFGHVISGMEIVNAIVQDDVMTKISIVRKGIEANKFDAVKIFSDYMGNKTQDDIKELAAQTEAKKKQEIVDAEAKKIYNEKYASVIEAKVKYFTETKATGIKGDNDFVYKIVKIGNGKKPVDGATVYINYAGYLQDGTLFDSNIEEVTKGYGKFDQNRATQNGYQPFPFQYGKKDGLIPGFIKGLENINFNDKIIMFIPSALGYGARGAGNVIPPNSNIVFEVEMLETKPGEVAPPISTDK